MVQAIKDKLESRLFEKAILCLCTIVTSVALTVGGWSLKQSMDSNVSLAEMKVEQEHIKKDMEVSNRYISVNDNNISEIMQKNAQFDERMRSIDSSLTEIKEDLKEALRSP